MRFVPDRHRQNGLAGLIDSLNGEVALLGGGQIAPLRNSPAEPSGDPRRDLTGSFDIRQVEALGILDPAAPAAKEEIVSGHD